MYELINKYSKSIIDSISAAHVSEYDWLIDNVNNYQKEEFQRRYKTYFRLHSARLPSNYLQVYFDKLGEGIVNTINASRLCEELYEVPSGKNGQKSIQFSFCTKLAHMLNNELPIYDKMIRQYYFFAEPGRKLDLDKRIDGYSKFYEFLKYEYKRILKQKLLETSIESFKDRKTSRNFSDQKIIDTLIWAYVKQLYKGALINNEYSY